MESSSKNRVARGASGLFDRLAAAPRLIKTFRVAFLLFIYVTFAAISFNGFYQKWGLRDSDGAWDNDVKYSFVKMIEGDAHKPFVYKSLLPVMANAFDAAIPDNVRTWALRELNKKNWWEVRNLTTQMRLAPQLRNEYLLRYYFVYFACVAFMLAALFVMRAICIEIGYGKVAATISPCVFSFVFVYFMSMGGFFYDFPEIFFLALAFLLALRASWLLLVPLTIFATLNKEVFIIFLIALLPLIRAHVSRMKTLLIGGGLMAVGAATHLIVRQVFAANPGGLESWLPQSIKFYSDLSNMIAFEVNFGIVTPRAYSLFTFVMLMALIVGGWRKLPVAVRQHALLAIALNVPLVLVFCGPGELRNFSICFVALFMLIAVNVQRWAAEAESPVSEGLNKA